MSQQSLSLHVNGEARSLPAGFTVRDLVRSLGLDAGHVAVAINRDVVARSQFARRQLATGDRVEILEAVGGG